MPTVGVNVCHGQTISYILIIHVTCESDQKLDTSLVIPAMTAVPGLADVLSILHVFPRRCQERFCT